MSLKVVVTDYTFPSLVAEETAAKAAGAAFSAHQCKTDAEVAEVLNTGFIPVKIVEEQDFVGDTGRLKTLLGAKGIPTMVELTLVRPPSGQLGPVMPAERAQSIQNSPVFGLYDESVDRESAYELLQKKGEKIAQQQADLAEQEAESKAAKKAATPTRSPRQADSATDRFVKNVASSVGRQLGTVIVRNISNSLIRGVLGGLLKR